MFLNYRLWMDDGEAFDYVESVLTPDRVGGKRLYSNRSDNSPDYPIPKMSNTEITESMGSKPTTIEDLHCVLTNFISQNNSNMDTIKKELDVLKSSILTKKVITEVKDHIMLEVNLLGTKLETFEKNFKTLREDCDDKIKKLETKLLEVEVLNKDYDVDRTCVVTGVRYEHGENLLEKCKSLVHETLELPDIPIKQTKRTPMYDNKPGVVKLEFHSLADKITVLRKKQKLKDLGSRIFIRSSQTHEQRLLQQHTMEILKMLGRENDFYINGRGRLVAKNNSKNTEVTKDENMMAAILEGVKTFFKDNPPPSTTQQNTH